MRTRPFSIAALTGTIAAVVALSAAAGSASARLPSVPTDLQAARGHTGLAIRPGQIIYTGDGSGFVGGARVSGARSKIHWTSWSATTATGEGYDQANDCRPSCAGGTYHAFPVRIVAWRPRTLAGSLVFSRLTLFYRRSVPRGAFRHYTFTDEVNRGTLGFGPPGYGGYCTGAGGLPRDPGCRNVHALPPGG